MYKAKFPKYAAPEIDVEVHSKLKGGRKRTLGPMFFNYNIKRKNSLSYLINEFFYINLDISFYTLKKIFRKN